MADKAEVTSTHQLPVAASGMSEECTESAGSAGKHFDTGVSGLKTIQVLKEWPIINSAVNKTQQLYNSMKTSCGALNSSFSLAEKSVTALCERSSKALSILYPAVRIADLAASEVAEAVQNKLPIVRQPPSKVPGAIRSGFSNLLAPLVDKIQSTVNTGKRRTRKAAKSFSQTCKKLVQSLDYWMEEAEKYINGVTSKAVKAPQVQDETSVTEQPQKSTRTLTRRALQAAANVALFYVGASFWLMTRLPLIGALLDKTLSPASSKSVSPARLSEIQSSKSSSRSSLASTATVVAVDLAEVGESDDYRQVISEAPSGKN